MFQVTKMQVPTIGEATKNRSETKFEGVLVGFLLKEGQVIG